MKKFTYLLMKVEGLIRHPEARKTGREDPVRNNQPKKLVEKFLDGRVASTYAKASVDKSLLTMTKLID
jgi:hypothetical protein